MKFEITNENMEIISEYLDLFEEELENAESVKDWIDLGWKIGNMIRALKILIPHASNSDLKSIVKLVRG